MVKLFVGIILGLLIGVACRWFDIPAPSPLKLTGALLVVAMTVGYMVTDRIIAIKVFHDWTPSGPRPGMDTSREGKRKDSERSRQMKVRQVGNFFFGGIVMTQALTAQTQMLNAAIDPRIDPQVRAFLAELNKDSSPFWELPQPKPQEILTGLQSKTPVDMSGVTTVEKTITQDGRTLKLYIMTPQHTAGKPGVLFFNALL